MNTELMNTKLLKEVLTARFIGIMLCGLIAALLSHSSGYAQQPEREKAAQLLKTASGAYEDGDMEKALSAVRESISVMPDNAEAYDRLGSLLLEKRLFDDSLAAFNQALKINPNLRQAKTGTGLSLLGKGDMAGAETTLKAALALNPYPAMTHYALGLVYTKMNDQAKALFHFKEGLKTFKEGKK
jgi:tetratricopeptide (TPR) repeat protein